MKDYTLFRLKCRCSSRMKIRGELIKMYGKDKEVKCPNCRKEYKIHKGVQDAYL